MFMKAMSKQQLADCAGRGKISLYKAKECIEKNIPEEEAVEKLLELIRKDIK